MKHTAESRAKISKALKGQPKSYEHRMKLSESLKGNQNRRRQLRLF